MDDSPLVLPFEFFAGMTQSEVDSEISDMFARSQALDKAMRGEIPIEDYLDLVEQQGYDMDYLVEQCSEQPQLC